MIECLVGNREELVRSVPARTAIGRLHDTVSMVTTGSRCEEPPFGLHPDAICGEVICLNGGVCGTRAQGFPQGDAPGRLRCLCEPGYSGVACELTEPCALNPCRSRGNCINVENSFLCECEPPFSGECTRAAGWRLCRPAGSKSRAPNLAPQISRRNLAPQISRRADVLSVSDE